ncbi:MAG TPA: C4-type zinc ribbon domain-containing protein [bacterium]
MSNEVGLENKVRDAVKLLTELQQIDDELKDIAMERGDLPEEVERLNSSIVESEAFLESRTAELQDGEKAIIDRRKELEEALDKQKKLQQQLYAVKNTREYDAVTAELTFVKEEITRCETAITATTARKAELERLLDERHTDLTSVRAEHKVKNADLQEKLSETAEDERQLMQRRDAVVAKIMKPLYAHYERIRKAKDGRGVAHITDSACGGCFAVIPPQTQVNIRKLMDIVLCETCGRIIVP